MVLCLQYRVALAAPYTGGVMTIGAESEFVWRQAGMGIVNRKTSTPAAKLGSKAGASLRVNMCRWTARSLFCHPVTDKKS